ncbi:MAG: hypothetical protein AABY27_06875 [Pseudomonadota bacterium]
MAEPEEKTPKSTWKNFWDRNTADINPRIKGIAKILFAVPTGLGLAAFSFSKGAVNTLLSPVEFFGGLGCTIALWPAGKILEYVGKGLKWTGLPLVKQLGGLIQNLGVGIKDLGPNMIMDSGKRLRSGVSGIFMTPAAALSALPMLTQGIYNLTTGKNSARSATGSMIDRIMYSTQVKWVDSFKDHTQKQQDDAKTPPIVDNNITPPIVDNNITPPTTQSVNNNNNNNVTNNNKSPATKEANETLPQKMSRCDSYESAQNLYNENTSKNKDRNFVQVGEPVVGNDGNTTVTWKDPKDESKQIKCTYDKDGNMTEANVVKGEVNCVLPPIKNGDKFEVKQVKAGKMVDAQRLSCVTEVNNPNQINSNSTLLNNRQNNQKTH